MSFRETLLFRVAAAALVAFPIAAGCSEGSEAGPLDTPDAGTSSADASVPDPRRPDGGTSTQAPCGNKKVDTGEECDDGNRDSGDGCSPICKRESAGPGDVCADAIPLDLARADGGTLFRASASGTTATFFDHYGASCGGGSGADVVYKITSAEVGRAVARVTAPFAAVLSVRTGCEDTRTELACKDTTSTNGGTAEIQFPVFANAPVYVFIDGYAAQKGEFALDVEVQTAFCGNGHAEYPETCDDGNTTPGDGCSATCMLENATTPAACPGMPYRIAAAGKASFAGDTSTMSNAGGNPSGCPSASGPNAVHAITPGVTGALKLDLLADYPNALVHVRRECSGNDVLGLADCAGTVEKLTPVSTTIPVVAEQTVYVFVDSSASSSSGLYVLDATLSAAACGNGLVDANEECDDGNAVSGDGCSSTCAAERDPATFTCPGKPLRLEAAAPGVRTLAVRGTTAPAAGETLPADKWMPKTTSPTCNGECMCGSKAPDVVYAVTADIDGYLKATVKGAFNATLSLRDACTPGSSSPLACAREATGNLPKTFFAPVNKETTYHLVVDGYADTASGAFDIALELTPSVCGNGVTEGGETCDDGAVADGDGCSATCQLEAEKARDLCTTAPAVALTENPDGSYGARVVSGTTNLVHNAGVTATHTLSPCSSNGPDAFFAVTAPVSGVMTATIASATFRSSLGARTACPGSGAQITCDATASNGGQQIVFDQVEAGKTYYLVVDGQNNANNKGRFTLDVKLAPSGCGDTYRAGAEECDDGNTVNGDGCSSTCTLEALPGAQTCPGHAVTLVGAGADVRRAVATVSTVGRPSVTGSVCGGSGPEAVVKITSDTDGVLQVRSDADFATLLHARSQCTALDTEIARTCSNLGTFSAPVTKNVPVYLYVDGVNGASGTAQLQITVTP